jgi:hypothetical protein
MKTVFFLHDKIYSAIDESFNAPLAGLSCLALSAKKPPRAHIIPQNVSNRYFPQAK